MNEHVSSMAGDLAEKGSNAASAATNQARTFATEFENIARRNPLGASWRALRRHSVRHDAAPELSSRVIPIRPSIYCLQPAAVIIT
jgi:hypothetical protein